MARVTVEDCVEKVESRFDLVLLAGQRAREIAAGSPLTIERNNDKDPVVSLREIAAGTVKPEDLLESKISDMQRYVERDEPEEDDISLEIAGRELSATNQDITPENLSKMLSDMVMSEVEKEMGEDAPPGEDGTQDNEKDSSDAPQPMFKDVEEGDDL